MHFSRRELREILKAWVMTSLAFAIVLTVQSVGIRGVLGTALLAPLLASLIAVGLGVILHELGHKYFGQRFGKHSEFRSFDRWLGLGVLMSFTGFLFIIPGAVFTSGPISKRQLGIIALAGPAINFLLALAFVPLLFLDGLAGYIGSLGVHINFLLALFNLLPFSIFDGAKVLQWDKRVWAGAFLIAILGVFARVYLQAAI